ncbi:MAG: ABC transporter permease [Actinobacteria bacterium]|nr:ABC transporter permease [Actinomycetota bacterium]
MKQKSIVNISKVKNFFLSRGFYIVFIIVFFFYSVTAKNFLTLSNLGMILRQASPIMVLAAGLTLVIITGNLDISVGSVAFLSATTGALLMTKLGVNPIIGVVVIILAGTVLGFINGLIIVRIGINPLITTLGMMITLRGAALYLMRASDIYLPDSLRLLGQLKIGPIYLESIVAIIILVIGQIVLIKTPFGRRICAIGNDEKTSRQIGIKVDKIKFLTFIISGLSASLGGILSVAQMGAITSYMGQGAEFTAIAIVVIGGTSLFGGEGSLLPGTLFGALTLTMIENGMNLMGLSVYLYPFVRGLIIFTAMFADSFRYRLRTRVIISLDEGD